MIGASLAFLIGRYLGRDFAASIAGNKLKRYDDAIGGNSFATILCLRLIYFPYMLINFGMGLTKVRFWDYFAGTALGIMVGTFIFTFFRGDNKRYLGQRTLGGTVKLEGSFLPGAFYLLLFYPQAPEGCANIKSD